MECREFWLQMILKSNVPNIKGLGQAKAKKLLDGQTDLKKAVQDVYKQYIGRDWEEEYNVNYRLLKLGTKLQ